MVLRVGGSMNGDTAKWIGLIAGIVMILGFGAAYRSDAINHADTQRNTEDIHSMQIIQALVANELKNMNKELREINDKLDGLAK